MNPLEARRRLLGRNVYKRTTEGNPAIAQGSLARMYPGITMQGWTEQSQYKGKNLFNLADLLSLIPESGSDNVSIVINVTGLKPNTYYTLSSIIEGNVGGAHTNRCLYFGDNKIDSAVFVGHPISKSSGDGGKIAVFFYPFRDFSQGIKSGRGNVQLEEGTVATTYEPYTGGQPSPSPDYPQPITNAGKHNEKTGKWEYEITIANEQTDPDKNQTGTLTSDRPLTKRDRLEKRNGQWGWVYKAAEVVLDGSVDENWRRQSDSNGKKQFYILLSDALYPYSDPFKEMFYCDTFLTTNNLGAIPKWQVRKGTYNGLAPVFKPSDDIDTVEAFRNFLAENQTTILYVTKEETFIPLSESEQEQMNALHTYYPTTVLSNDCGCNMTLTYKTKKSLEVAT